MFSVPGWNVSAPLATQVEKAKVKDAVPGKKAQKRKQKQQQKQQEHQVDEKNVGDLWEKVVEGKGDPSEIGALQFASGANSGKLGDGKKRKRQSEQQEEKGKKEDGELATAPEKGDQNKGSETPAKDAGEEATSAPAASKRDKKKRKKDHKPESNAQNTLPSAAATVPPLIPEPANLTPLQKSMRAKLTSARFRHLNESLYTKPSAESLEIFKENPDMFLDYHRGFAQQVEVWPENPVDGYVDAILTRGKARVKDPWKDKKRQEKNGKKAASAAENDTAVTNAKPLPRNMRGHCTIADLGCGTASLSYRLQPSLKSLNLTLHSFDLSQPTGPTHDLVTVADISNLPLPDNSVDVAIFCLALMGTNWTAFIDEAYRILRWRGELWVSEIKSRFGRVAKGGKQVPINSIGSLRKPEKKPAKGKKGKAGKDEEIPEGPQDSADEAELAVRIDGAEAKNEGTDVSAFVAVLKSRGFVLDALPERQHDAIDLSNKMFVKMQFVKAAPPTKGKNVKPEDVAKREAGRAQPAMRMGIKGKKFATLGGDGEESGEEADAKVLKPCLYKIR